MLRVYGDENGCDTKLASILIFAMLTASMAFPRSPPQACASIREYAVCNQVDPPSIAIRVVVGRVLSEINEPVNGACLSLFTEKEHKWVTSVVANGEGQFTFATVMPGSYRLVVRDPQNAFYLANGRVRVYSRGQGPVPKFRGLLVRLRPVGTGICGSITRE